jgi:hypothetical protein
VYSMSVFMLVSVYKVKGLYAINKRP